MSAGCLKKIRKHGRLSSPKQIMQILQQTPIIICDLTPAWFVLLILSIINSKKNGAFPTSSTFFASCVCRLVDEGCRGKAFKQQRTDQAARPAVDDVAGDGWDLGGIPGKGEGSLSRPCLCAPNFNQVDPSAWHKLGTREKVWSPSPYSCGIDSWWPGRIQRPPTGGPQRVAPNGWPQREVNVASEQGRTGNMMVQKSQPLTRPPVDPNNKNKNLRLSIESWLFHRDPYNGLLSSPHNWVVSSPIPETTGMFFIARLWNIQISTTTTRLISSHCTRTKLRRCKTALNRKC